MSKSPNTDRAPLVSVCIPTYNRRDFLRKTLETISRQTLQDFEVLVCDDCSTDGTFEFLSSLNWPNLRILRNSKNLNLPGSMTRLFSQARGKYIGMQHDHDLYEPQFLEKMVEMMEFRNTAGFGCCAFTIVDGDDGIIEAPSSWFNFYPASGLRRGNEVINALATQVFTPIPAMGTLFRKDVVELSGGYRPDWYIASDEDLYRRVALISDVAFSRERLFRIRPRPMDRKVILGGWKSIYTLHEFRVDTTKKYLKAGRLRKKYNLVRLRILRLKSLLKECASLYIRGQHSELESATSLHNFPRLPGPGPSLSLLETLTVRSLISLLKAIGPVLRGFLRPRPEPRIG